MGEKYKERIDKSNEQQNDERREAEVIKGKEQRESDIYWVKEREKEERGICEFI